MGFSISEINYTVSFFLKQTVKGFLRSRMFLWYYIRELERFSRMSDLELREIENQRFLKTFRTAIKKTPFYKELYASHNLTCKDIKSVEDIKKLPVITKEMIRKKPKRLLSVKPWFLFRSKTSGTTGTPLTVFFSWRFLLRDYAYILFFRRTVGVKDGDRVVSLRGDLDSRKIKMFVFPLNTLFLSSYHINNKTCFYYYQCIRQFSPRVLKGYPSSLYNLALLFKEFGLKLKIPLTFTSSETLFDFQKDLIERVFETRVYDVYGNSERSISLRQLNNTGKYFVPAGYCLLELFEDSIVTTTLFNRSFPLIRYEVKDRLEPFLETSGESEYQEFPVSPSSPGVEQIIGRTEDTIVDSKGTKFGRLNFLFKDMRNIKNAQIIQKIPGEIEIRIVPDPGFSETDEKRLMKNVDKWIGLKNMKVNIRQVESESLIYTSRNKFKLVVSMVKASENV